MFSIFKHFLRNIAITTSESQSVVALSEHISDCFLETQMMWSAMVEKWMM